MIELLNPTGNPAIDKALTGLIGIYETAFPARIRAYYLTGSFADGSATPDSDIDLNAIFAGTLPADEAARFRQLTRFCEQLAAVQLDCSPLDEATLQRGVKASLKSGLLLYGEAILDAFPLEPLEEHIQRCMFLAFRYMFVLRGQADNLRFPLDYPDPAGPFYGYERYASYLGENTFGPGLRIIISAVTMMTTTLLAMQTGEQVGSKQASIERYRQQIGGEWAELAAALYRACKTDWRYQIPEAEHEQQRLRDLCAQLLAFENDFIAQGRGRLRANVQHSDETVRHFAAEALRRIQVD